LGHPPPSNEQLKNLHPVFVYEKPWTGEDGITTLRKFTLYVGPLGGNKNENPASAFVLENLDGVKILLKNPQGHPITNLMEAQGKAEEMLPPTLVATPAAAAVLGLSAVKVTGIITTGLITALWLQLNGQDTTKALDEMFKDLKSLLNWSTEQFDKFKSFIVDLVNSGMREIPSLVSKIQEFIAQEMVPRKPALTSKPAKSPASIQPAPPPETGSLNPEKGLPPVPSNVHSVSPTESNGFPWPASTQRLTPTPQKLQQNLQDLERRAQDATFLANSSQRNFEQNWSRLDDWYKLETASNFSLALPQGVSVTSVLRKAQITLIDRRVQSLNSAIQSLNPSDPQLPAKIRHIDSQIAALSNFINGKSGLPLEVKHQCGQGVTELRKQLQLIKPSVQPATPEQTIDRAALTTFAQRVLASMPSSVSPGGGLPPEDDKVLNAMINAVLNGLMTATQQSVGELTGAQRTSLEHQARAIVSSILTGLVVPVNGSTPAANVGLNALSGMLETALRQVQGLEPLDAVKILESGAWSAVAGELFNLLHSSLPSMRRGLGVPGGDPNAPQTNPPETGPINRMESRKNGKSSGSPTGTPTEIPQGADTRLVQSIQAENDTANLLAAKLPSKEVMRNPGPLANGRKPDYLIMWKSKGNIYHAIYDCYAPAKNASIYSMLTMIKNKVNKGQAPNIVVNLVNTTMTANEFVEEYKKIAKEGMQGVDVGQIIVLDRNQNMRMIGSVETTPQAEVPMLDPKPIEYTALKQENFSVLNKAGLPVAEIPPDRRWGNYLISFSVGDYVFTKVFHNYPILTTETKELDITKAVRDGKYIFVFNLTGTRIQPDWLIQFLETKRLNGGLRKLETVIIINNGEIHSVTNFQGSKNGN
jgi:hypothetical protein